MGHCPASRVTGRSVVGGLAAVTGAGAALGAIAVAVLVLLGAQPALGAPSPVTFTGPTNFAVGNNPLSVAVGDVNGDGHLDLAVANFNAGISPGSVSALLGNGTGGFSGATNFPAGASGATAG